MFEKTDKVPTIPTEEVAKLTYDWQRATPVESWEFNGRLALSIRGHPGNHGWGDRQRWTLESRLPRFVVAVEQVAQARADTQTRAAQARRHRREDWHAAVSKARADYLTELNRSRLDKQLEAYGQAERLRTYADAVTSRADMCGPDERAPALAWADWIRSEAERHDPLGDDADLRFAEPAEISHWDLDKYMPRGFTASGPPD